MSEEHKYWNPDRETLSADEFHAVQEQALLRQLDYLWARSDFYLQKFSDADLARGDIPADSNKFIFLHHRQNLPLYPFV